MSELVEKIKQKVSNVEAEAGLTISRHRSGEEAITKVTQRKTGGESWQRSLI